MPTDDPADLVRPFPYLDFARRELVGWQGPNNLGLSGVHAANSPAAEALGVPTTPDYTDSWRTYRAAVADRHGLAPEQVHPSAGTSHANFAACLGLARGGRMAVEQPAYEALPGIAAAIGATLTRFERDADNGWCLDAPSLRAAAKGADLIVVSDLHNPTGKRLTEQDFALLQEIADAEDARVLVDEVYAAFDIERTIATAALRDPRFLATNSTTKVWGFGDLRAGWILGPVADIERIAAWDDLVNPMLVGSSLLAAAGVLRSDAAYLDSVRTRANARRDEVDAWVAGTPGVSWIRPDGGITGLLRIGDGAETDQGDRLAHAASHQGVRIVPGSFFQRPAWARLSFDVAPDELAQALAALAQTLGGLA